MYDVIFWQICIGVTLGFVLVGIMKYCIYHLLDYFLGIDEYNTGGNHGWF